MSVIRSHHRASYLVVVWVVVWGVATSKHITIASNSKHEAAAESVRHAFPGSRMELERLSLTSGEDDATKLDQTAVELQQMPSELATATAEQLPKPTNVSLVIVSWYPPLLRLTWRLHDPQETKLKLHLYNKLASDSVSQVHHHNETSIGTAAIAGLHLLEDLDRLELDESGERLFIGDKLLRQTAELEEVRQRKILVRKSLNCFQITYNIVNSRFKTSEELAPHASSLHLVNLLPATEYSLQVAAVYLNGLRTLGERIQFVTPADNESRRFKDNTYRPIHRYPEEGRGPGGQRGQRGLEQARLEELTIVAFALLFWVATICLFFNKWGKIRMLEPYQPAYREADSPAPPFVAGPGAHHSSLHQLGSVVGGSGAKLASSLCGAVLGQSADGAPTGAPSAAAAAAVGIVPLSSSVVVGGACKLSAGSVSPALGTGNGPPNSAAAASVCVGSNGAAASVEPGLRPTTSSIQANELGALVTCAGAGAPRRLATALRRGAAEVGESSGPPGCEQKQHRRTEAELNLLFQSKANALANAANLWTVRQQQHQQHQQRQKLRQHQYRTQRVDLETLRRTSKALLRQGQLSCSPFESALGQQSALGTGNSLVGGSAGIQQRGGGGGQQHHSRNHEERCLSVELGGSHGSTRLGGRAALAVDQQTSKLLERRLLFISKSHQHHHVATSASSGTLRKESSSAAGCNISLAAQVAGQVGSLAACSIVATHQPSAKQDFKPNSVSLDTPEQLSSGAGARKRGSGATNTKPGPTGGSAPQMACLHSGGFLAEQVSRLGSPEVDATRPLHHIHIEPPSPPSTSVRQMRHLASGGDLLDDSLSSGLHLAGSSIGCGSGSDDLAECQDHITGQHLHRSGSISSVCRGHHSDQHPHPPTGISFHNHTTTGGEACHQLGNRSRSSAYLVDYQQQQQQQQQELTYSNLRDSPSGNSSQCLDNQRPLAVVSCRDRPAICVEPMVAGRVAPHQDTCYRDYCNPARAHTTADTARSSTDESPHDGPTADEMSADDELANHQHHSHHEESRDVFARLRESSRQARGRRQTSSVSTQLSATNSTGAPQVSRKQATGCVGPRNRSSSSSLAELACYLRPKSGPTSMNIAQTSLGSAMLAGGCSLCSTGARGSSCAALLGIGGGGGGPSARVAVQQQHRAPSPHNQRPRLCSVFVGSTQSRGKRGSFQAVLHALSQKKSKSAEDVAHLSSLVLEIWARVDRNPLLQSVSHQQLASNQHQSHLNSHKPATGAATGSHERHRRHHQRAQPSAR